MKCIELCAGAGGQAIGLERAGFESVALVEIDAQACATLRLNRPNWHVIEGSIADFDGTPYFGIDLLAGGPPCPPFSKAGKQLGADDERDVFPHVLRIIDEARPKTVMLENVKGFLDARFHAYRQNFKQQLEALGYDVRWKLVNAVEFGVSQSRPRVVIVAVQKQYVPFFEWPITTLTQPTSVGDLLIDLISAENWQHADAWREQANRIAPTIVGGSKKHGGPDLGPTGAKKAWAKLGVDGKGIANVPPPAQFVGMPRLTNRMVARIQGFPDEWQFFGRKTPVYRQIGNAFPPAVAAAVARSLRTCLERAAEALPA